MIKLTDNETKLLLSFAYCEMNATNGNPTSAPSPSELHTYVWLEDRKVNDLSITSKKGVLSSLVKKELVTVSKDDEGDYLNFTDLGYETVMELIKTDAPSEEPEKKIETPSEEPVIGTSKIYLFKNIASRFNTPEQHNHFKTAKISFANFGEDYFFTVRSEQIEDFTNAIRTSKIFSRFKDTNLPRHLSSEEALKKASTSEKK
ncbi:hypothetical protein P10VF_045 [Rhizobium phage vB_RleM_P10VF]|uniref:Uncharacterized protein n=1 Tax=Rhizobium phage vB_RleM_P10VF TaxID=1527770 RepID=A0A076YIM6_9CAUD|nr:hypothetical protein P10VF_045 [Rhizobium phage vB_RleM_P10VF]AIK68258.1 hypothetical protein P10VF_045 [Rhizobium phage vB_RleM_P10VF]